MLSDSMKKNLDYAQLNSTIKFCWRLSFDHPKPSLQSCEVAHKNLARSVQPFCCLFDLKLTFNQAYRQAK